MSVAATTAVEILQFTPESQRAQGLFRALAAGAATQGVSVERTAAYRGAQPWLFLWGPGHPQRAAVLAHHVRAGGRVLAWDLAYWDRQRKARVSIDGPHPAAWVMRHTRSASRWMADAVPTGDLWQRQGPILFAGLGDKARVQYGAGDVDAWEAMMMRACQARWPHRPILYRRKKTSSPTPGWARNVSGPATPIEQALRGVSLVVTWHSNVAVDAIRFGIPVICRDGAASAVCPSDLSDDPQPLPPALRDRFLANLAWFQWAPEESRAFWAWACEVLA